MIDKNQLKAGFILLGIFFQNSFEDARADTTVVEEFQFEERSGATTRSITSNISIEIGNGITHQPTPYIERVMGLEGRRAIRFRPNRRQHGDQALLIPTARFSDFRTYQVLYRPEIDTVSHYILASTHLSLYVYKNKLKLYQPHNGDGQMIRAMIESRTNILPGNTYKIGVVSDPDHNRVCLYVNNVVQACTPSALPRGSNNSVLLGGAAGIYDSFKIFEGNPYLPCQLWLENRFDVVMSDCPTTAPNYLKWIVFLNGEAIWTKNVVASDNHRLTYLNSINKHGEFEVFLSDRTSFRKKQFHRVTNIVKFSK